MILIQVKASNNHITHILIEITVTSTIKYPQHK
jgi:hypothetical protein